MQLPERTLFADQDFAWRDDPYDVAIKQRGSQQKTPEQQRKEGGDAEPLVVCKVSEAGQGDQTQNYGNACQNEPLVERRALAQSDFILV
ncbi:hypothetical protein [Bradyrhizobium jicamae]|uniref:hypothetical protein n=1 Tax=Bradyrhizobium jicamae TaxID=280332 RepID=UPI0012EE6AB1|nr:hypothetical protein [Bradyrhizobium jicamae]